MRCSRGELGFLIKKKKNSFLRADLRTDFRPPEIAFSFKDVDDEISKDFGNILCKYHDSNFFSSYFLALFVILLPFVSTPCLIIFDIRDSD